MSACGWADGRGATREKTGKGALISSASAADGTTLTQQIESVIDRVSCPPINN